MRLLKLLFFTIMFSLLWTHVEAQCFVSQTHVDNGNGNITFQGQASSNMPSMGTYYWNFGDGGTGNGQTVNHTYTQSGWYAPCVTYYDSLGCQATMCDSIYVQVTSPCANFNAGFQYSVGTNGTVSLFGFVNNSTSGGAVQYVWNLGNGATITGQNVTQVMQPGSYLVCLTATDTLYGCTSTFCDTVVVATTNPCANFMVQVQHNILTGGAVAFNAGLSGGTPGSYVDFQWSFGDGSSGYGPNPTHQYNQTGWYAVCVTATDSLNGCMATDCDSIYVQVANPCAGFNAGYQYSVGSNGVLSLFGFVNNSTTGNTAQYSWNLGNGINLYGQNVTQAMQPGTYLVCLTATDSLNGCSSTYCDTVVVANTNPCANFMVQVQHNTLTGGAVAFNAGLSGGTPGTYVDFQWTFGDGSAGFGPNPTHQYNQTGWYAVCVTATDSLNGCTATDCDSIYVQVASPCAGFNAGYQYSVGANGTVSLFGFVNNGTTGAGIQYAWNLGLGSILYGQNVSQVLQPGTYVICLTATDSLNGCTSTYCDTVNVGNSNPCNLTVTASSVVDTNGGTTPGTLINFSATTSGGTQPMNFVWDFGDGATAVGQNLGHVYTQANTGYLACVTVTDANGCTATDCDSVFTGNTNTNPCANFTGGFQYTVSPSGQLQLYGNASTVSPNNMVVYQWNLGNGTVLFGQQVSVTLQPGTYQICMMAMDSLYGCSFTTCQTVTVNQVGTICSQYTTGFQWFDQGNASVNFTGYASIGSLTTQSLYLWDFGDGTSAVGQNVNHMYNGPGVYYVCLTAYDSVSNCTATYCDTVSVTIGNPCGNFNASYTFVSNGGGAVQFNASSTSNANVIYTWDFGDGQTATGQNVVHLYYPNFNTIIGYYYVCVTAYEPSTGCSSTYCGYLIIINLPFPPTVPTPPITISTGNGGIIIFKDDQSEDIQRPIDGQLDATTINAYVEQIEKVNAYGVVKMYPNPTTDFINLNVLSVIDEPVDIQIDDISNKHIKSVRKNLNIGENTLQIDTESLQSGIYILKVIGNDQISTLKFIKQ